jgi:regulator of sigma E protease
MRSLGGPISVFNMAGDAASQGIPTFVTFLAFFSVNLAVLNLMPVPVLDGGHIVMFTVELIRRRPITLEMRDRVMKVGLLLVGLLMVTAITNDIVGVVQSLFTKA